MKDNWNIVTRILKSSNPTQTVTHLAPFGTTLEFIMDQMTDSKIEEI